MDRPSWGSHRLLCAAGPFNAPKGGPRASGAPIRKSPCAAC
ncbi:Uncharacterised protein [Bordetella pertussis]|nr:Uncharacterised protein [Bordetella pertussis]